MKGNWLNVARGPDGAVYVDGKRVPRYEEKVVASGPVWYSPGHGDYVWVNGKPKRVFTPDEIRRLAE